MIFLHPDILTEGLNTVSIIASLSPLQLWKPLNHTSECIDNTQKGTSFFKKHFFTVVCMCVCVLQNLCFINLVVEMGETKSGFGVYGGKGSWIQPLYWETLPKMCSQATLLLFQSGCGRKTHPLKWALVLPNSVPKNKEKETATYPVQRTVPSVSELPFLSNYTSVFLGNFLLVSNMVHWIRWISGLLWIYEPNIMYL